MRTRPLKSSAISRLPHASSSRLLMYPNDALSAGPPSPADAATPFPTTTVTAPVACDQRLTTPASPDTSVVKNTSPEQSTATPAGDTSPSTRVVSTPLAASTRTMRPFE